MADESTTIPLSKPITAHGEEISELTLRDAGIGALEGVKATLSDTGLGIDLGDLPKVIARLADIPPSSARTISLRDLSKLVPEVFDFLGGTQPTGEN